MDLLNIVLIISCIVTIYNTIYEYMKKESIASTILLVAIINFMLWPLILFMTFIGFIKTLIE